VTPGPQAIILGLALAACGPKPPSGPGPQVPGGDADPDGRIKLDETSWAGLFEEEQAAYYVESDDTLWLVLRLTGDANEAEVLGHVFGIIANKFDYSADPRKHIVLIAYKGKVEKRKNYGIRIGVDALLLLQTGKITIDELTEDAGYIMNADISALKPFITK
jgi:hypothetical protein